MRGEHLRSISPARIADQCPHHFCWLNTKDMNLPIDWTDFESLNDRAKREILKWLAEIQLTVNSPGYWEKYRFTIFTMPVKYLSETGKGYWNNNRWENQNWNYFDLILDHFWNWVHGGNGTFCKFGSLDRSEMDASKYMKRMLELTTILKQKGVFPTCPQIWDGPTFAERYDHFRKLEKNAGLAARLFSYCVESRGQNFVSAKVREQYWKPGGIHDRVWDPAYAEQNIKRRFEQNIEPVNKRVRHSGGKGKTRKRTRNSKRR